MTETTFEHRDRMALRDQLVDVLAAAASHRHERETVVDTPYGPEAGWVAYEREQMLAAVNRERATHRRPDVTVEDVARVERMAAGHVDYAMKYALYCSELATGITEPRP